MKKNFFKKLSFVMALAMTVSVVAPAASAFAATTPTLSAATKYLYVNETGKASEYDFNVKNLAKGAKVVYSTDNKAVATVDAKSGLTEAVSRGTAHVSAKITLATKKTLTLKATVYVRDYIKTVDITAPATKYAVATEYDFNRTFVNNGGSATTSSICRWDVTTTVATAPTVDATTGKVTFNDAGKYTVTVNAFNSAADYESWKVSKDASLVKATKSVDVTVVGKMLSATQVDLNTATVKFDSAVADTSKITVYNVIGGQEVAATVKKVTLSTDKKTATVDMYVNFVEGATVVVKYPEMDSVQFVAATAKVADVKEIKVVAANAELGTSKTLDVQFLNKDGVDIANSDLYSRLTWESTNINANITQSTHSVMMYKVGDTATLTATFHTYNYDTTTGKEIGNLTSSAVVTCVDKSSANVGTLDAYTIVTSGPNYGDVKHSIAAGDSSYKLFVQLKGKQADGTTDLFTNNNSATPFKFQSSDTSVLNVNPTSGDLYAYKAGSVVVLVSYNDKVVATCPITVTGAREVATMTIDSYSFGLSNDLDVVDTKPVTVTIKDQLGADYSNFTATVTKTSNNAGTVLGTAAPSGNKYNIQFNGTNGTGVALADGSYTYQVKVVDNNTKKELVSYITVNLQKPSDQNVYYYAIETDKSAYDMKLTSTDSSEDVTLSVFGYASNGVRNVRLDANSCGLAVTDSNNATKTLVAATNDAKINLVTVSGGAGGSIQKAAKGTYTAKVTTGSVVIASAYFTVADTQATPVVTINKYFTNQTTVLAAVKDCVTVKLDGTDITSSIVSPVTYGVVNNSNGSVTLQVKEVTYTENYTVNGTAGVLTYTIPVNQTITYNYN